MHEESRCHLQAGSKSGDARKGSSFCLNNERSLHEERKEVVGLLEERLFLLQHRLCCVQVIEQHSAQVWQSASWNQDNALCSLWQVMLTCYTAGFIFHYVFRVGILSFSPNRRSSPSPQSVTWPYR